MTFELLILKKEWFYHHRDDQYRFEGIKKLVNKSYDKSRFKFGIIQTQRIKSSQTIPEDLALQDVDDFNLFILLGSNEVFKKLSYEDGYIRDFSQDATNLEQSYDCDIPEKYYTLFDLSKIDDLKITIVDNDFNLDLNIISRSLGSAGFRTYKHTTLKDEDIELELTAFTSFMRKAGPKILNLVLDKCILNSKYFSLLFPTLPPLNHYKKLILHADVIKEHKLVEYYVSACSFVPSPKDDILLEIADDNMVMAGPLECGIYATQNFHISFIHREILLK
ncbi:uncharacterized protein RJT21DRAFT_51655 [Scheffersomyces amazonensis]|uniref:uncharacterized protein n=1 Tax=Scheffersomyces amazonensis TaxID=1078765 RepID=UPI00315C82F8